MGVRLHLGARILKLITCINGQRSTRNKISTHTAVIFSAGVATAEIAKQPQLYSIGVICIVISYEVRIYIGIPSFKPITTGSETSYSYIEKTPPDSTDFENSVLLCISIATRK